MNIHRTFTRASLTTALAIMAISTAAWAGPPPTECGLIGTWAGHAGTSAYWFGVHTAGTHDKKGEMLFNWVAVDSSLLGGATRLTDGHGVFDETDNGHYAYTWYAYGVDADALPIYTVRVHGLAENTDCNTIRIEYTYEVFAAVFPPQDVSGDPLYTTTGVAHEARIPVTATP